MRVDKAKGEVLAFLQAEWEKRNGIGLTADFALWDRRGNGFVGIRVSEVSFAHDRGGIAYMQGDGPESLAICAAVERLLLDYCVEFTVDDIEADRRMLAEAIWGKEG